MEACQVFTSQALCNVIILFFILLCQIFTEVILQTLFLSIPQSFSWYGLELAYLCAFESISNA